MKCIQIRHMDLLPLQDWGRSRQGWRVVVHYCWHQLIFFIDLKHPLSSSPNNFFFDCWPVYFEFIDWCSLILKIVLRCDWKLSSSHIQIRQTHFIPPQACVRVWQGCRFSDCTFHHQYIEWLPGNHLKIFLFIIVKMFLAAEEEIQKTGYWFINIIIRYNHIVFDVLLSIFSHRI